MIEEIPLWIEVLFIITCLASISLFYYANGKPKVLTIALILWSILQSVLAYHGFYLNTETIPPRFALVLIPTTLLIVYGILPRSQSWFLRVRNTRLSTFLHTVRLPVEIVLFGLYTHAMIPRLMTFEGRNYDIIMGITAPIVALLFVKRKINNLGLFIWNIIGLILVLFILLNGILSAELPFQQFGFEQPNRGINYFPFVLLPATIVPIVIWTHLSDIIKLRKEMRAPKKKTYEEWHKKSIRS